MTDQLKALLILLGVLGGGVAVWMVAPGTTKQDLTDAVQAGACPNRVMMDVACSIWWDGGYRDIKTRAARCDDVDGGRFFVLPSFSVPLPDGGRGSISALGGFTKDGGILRELMLLRSTCRRIGSGYTLCDGGGVETDLDPDAVPTVPAECACVKLDAGPASCLKSDGGSWWDAGTGGSRWNNVIPAGDWSGPGCQTRPCMEFSGLSGQAGCWP